MPPNDQINEEPTYPDEFPNILESERLATRIRRWDPRLDVLRNQRVDGVKHDIFSHRPRGFDLLGEMAKIRNARGTSWPPDASTINSVATILSRNAFASDPLVMEIRQILDCPPKTLPSMSRLEGALTVPYDEVEKQPNWTHIAFEEPRSIGHLVLRTEHVEDDARRPARERMAIARAVEGLENVV